MPMRFIFQPCLFCRYPEDKKDPVVAEYMKTGALKACDEGEHRFFSDGREYVAGSEFTAAGVCKRYICLVSTVDPCTVL